MTDDFFFPPEVTNFLKEPVRYFSLTADMLTLGCGAEVMMTDHKENKIPDANDHLHIQGTWRILYRGRMVAGRQDYRNLYSDALGYAPTVWERLEKLTQYCLKHGVTVRDITFSPWGDLTMTFSHDLTLQAIADSQVSEAGEYLRWFRRQPQSDHCVFLMNHQREYQ